MDSRWPLLAAGSSFNDKYPCIGLRPAGAGYVCGNESPESAGDMSLCSGRNCPNKDQSVTLNACARCKKAHYCGRSCQKKHWGAHKHRCFSPDTPHVRVGRFTIEAIQSSIDHANCGDVLVLEEGTYEGNEILRINKPITLLGQGKDKTKLACSELRIEGGNDVSASKHSVTIADFEASNSTIENEHYKAVNICSIKFAGLLGSNNDTVSTGRQAGKIIFLDCDIIGGADGLCIGGDGVHLKHTTIKHAQSRGIFSGHSSFIIEDSTVSNCGGYGIKGRAGWIEKGKNRIQSGPWSSWGGPSGMFGGL